MIPSTPPPERCEVLVVGAGLAGLSCALLLERQGVNVHVVEASDAVGGRVRTDAVDSFMLDRGFQVLLTAYEEVQAQVDLPRLDLKAFAPGSLVWTGSSLDTLGDPFRDPRRALASLTAAVGTIGDKLKVASLRRRLLARSAEAALQGEDRTTQAELEALGFSDDFIDAFFRPFLGGVFLERELETSARLFRYYFRCFAAGEATLPAHGMQRLPELLAAPLEDRITLNRPVGSVASGRVELCDGTTVQAEQVVVAVDGAAAAELLGERRPSYKDTVTSYFAAEKAPVDAPLLILDGEGTGPANHVAVISRVAPAYAPAGAHLVSVSGVGPAAADPEAFEREAPRQLRRWFGASVDRWRLLRTYRIAHALPKHPPGSLNGMGTSPRRGDGLFVAGDHVSFGAIQGALLSGRRAAEAVLDER